MSEDDNRAVLEQFGRGVCRRRELLGISQEELAHRAGVHRTLISTIEGGKRLPRLDTLVRLVSALDTSYDELLGGLRWEPTRVTQGRFIAVDDQADPG